MNKLTKQLLLLTLSAITGVMIQVFLPLDNMTSKIIVGALFSLLVVVLAVSCFLGAKKLMGGDPDDLLRVTTEMSQGNLATSFNLPQSSRPSGLTANLLTIRNTFKDGIRAAFDLSEQVQNQVDNMSKINTEINQNAYQVKESIDASTAAIAEISQTIQVFSGHTSDILSKITSIQEKINQTTKAAEDGREIIDEGVKTIGYISRGNEKIANFVSRIQEVSRKTNLLSLNAAIEASKAGELGKGFGVVAEEVKKLADVSSIATQEIDNLIQTNYQDVQHGAEVVGKMKEAFTEIIEVVLEVSEQVDSVSTDAEYQKNQAQEMEIAINSIDEETVINVSSLDELFEQLKNTEALGLNFIELSHELSKSFTKFQLNKN